MAMNHSMAESSSSYQPVPRSQGIMQPLSTILDSFPQSILLSDDPPSSLLNDEATFEQITRRLRLASSGSGEDDLCRWIYDTFQSNISNLQLVILSFVPTIAGVYLSRSVSSKETLAGFEAVFLSLYSHEMVNRGAEPVTVRLPNVQISSSVESSKGTGKGKRIATEPDLTEAILSPILEPCSTIRSTRRAWIVSIALDLYYSKISLMPIFSKLEFCKISIAWSGRAGLLINQDESNKEQEDQELNKFINRVPLTWELYQPILRILGHCLLGPTLSEELKEASLKAVKCVYARAMKEFEVKAILVSRSLVKLGKMMEEPIPEPSFSSGSGGDVSASEIEAMQATILTR
ncbi:hypothetical protein LUZ60_004008 [Juncus effusus]|nr:hypothetical protein LUZ60_004008 [Juncus effusus]